MKKLVSLLSVLIITVISPSLLSQAEDEVEQSGYYNPREEYLLGIGPVIGGISGGVGFDLDYNLNPKIGLQAGVGSGYYFESIFLTSRYYLLLSKLSPFIAMGYALWRANSGIEKLNNIKSIKNLNLENGDFAHLIPLSIGLQYMSDGGIAAYVTFDYILSPGTTSGIPYGSAGIAWYF